MLNGWTTYFSPNYALLSTLLLSEYAISSAQNVSFIPDVQCLPTMCSQAHSYQFSGAQHGHFIFHGDFSDPSRQGPCSSAGSHSALAYSTLSSAVLKSSHTRPPLSIMKLRVSTIKLLPALKTTKQFQRDCRGKRKAMREPTELNHCFSGPLANHDPDFCKILNGSMLGLEDNLKWVKNSPTKSMNIKGPVL